MSFFDFVGALGAGGGEMARTISDIQRRRLEEQENMDRIAMQREQMAGLDRRQAAGFDHNTDMYDTEQSDRVAALAASRKYDLEAQAEQRIYDEAAEDTRFGHNQTVQGEADAAEMAQIGARGTAQRGVLDYGAELDLNAAELGDAQSLMSRKFSSIIDSVDGDMNQARVLIEAEMDGADPATVDAALGRTLQYRQTSNADILNPEARTTAETWPSPVASSDKIGGDIDLGGTGGGPSATWPQRIGRGAANMFPKIPSFMPTEGSFPMPSAGEVEGWAGARTLEEYRKATAANDIRARLDAGDITQELAARLIAELEAAGGN